MASDIFSNSEIFVPILRLRQNKILEIDMISGIFCFGAQFAIVWQTALSFMILRFIFRQMSLQKQARYLKKKGIMLGTRLKNGRKIHIYMLRDLFIEVRYKNDNANDEAEQMNMLRGLNNLNDYLEREFKASF
jgi:hypothetical protein